MEDLKCPVCHKTFIVPNKRSWAYKKMSQLICSWTCLRTLEMKKGEDRGMKTKVPDEAKEEKPVNETKAEELPKITSPVVYDDMIVREVEGLFGRYRRSDVHNATYIDFELADSMDIMSYTVDQWRKFRDELEKSAKILGVEL